MVPGLLALTAAYETVVATAWPDQRPKGKSLPERLGSESPILTLPTQDNADSIANR